MANLSAQMVAAYIRQQGLKVEVLGDDGECISARVGAMDNMQGMRVLIIFDEDGNSVQFRTVDYLQVPKGKQDVMYKVLNDLNKRFRWVRFYMDDDGSIVAEEDAVIDLETCGQECLELLIRLIRICDEAYPSMMKAIWS